MLKSRSLLFQFTPKKIDSDWNFHLHQNGFKSELIEKSFEEEIKRIVKNKIIDFLKRISNSSETDFYKNAQLWCGLIILENSFEIEWTEIK